MCFAKNVGKKQLSENRFGRMGGMRLFSTSFACRIGRYVNAQKVWKATDSDDIEQGVTNTVPVLLVVLYSHYR